MVVCEDMIAKVLYEVYNLNCRTEPIARTIKYLVFSEMSKHPEYDYEEVDVEYWVKCALTGRFEDECVF